eukprot:TRINITY_DN117526_c0_g1_i1.p1 TRINITY_DN117526_c0_g1~~TRINITY_DN117526_c0_g1_i1.p1  ORF type:complete len:463 (-),score=102.09 TRINITY_DN117526_c0_g1_i1:30-1418(-)
MEFMNSTYLSEQHQSYSVDVSPDGASPAEIGYITLLPAISMGIGSMAISMGTPSDKLQARFQHLSAGLLIGAVVCDIFPILRHSLKTGAGENQVNWLNIFAAVAGFAAALTLMYTVKGMELEGGDDEDSSGDQSDASPRYSNGGLEAPLLPAAKVEVDEYIPGSCPEKEEARSLRMAVSKLAAKSRSLSQLVAAEDVDREAVDEEVHIIEYLLDAARRRCRGIEPLEGRNAARLRHHVGELDEDIAKLLSISPDNLVATDKQLRVVIATLRHIHKHAEHGTFRRWGAKPPAPRKQSEVEEPPRKSSEVVDPPSPMSTLQWGLVLAVVIDSCVDGMLIGLSGSVDKKTGWLMSMATAIEMGFLGFSFACSVSQGESNFLKKAILALPPFAMLATSLVSAVGADFIQGSAAFVGLIGFSLVALLFLVVEELLIEAHEKEGGSEWHVSMMLYVGLLLSIILDVLL